MAQIIGQPDEENQLRASAARDNRYSSPQDPYFYELARGGQADLLYKDAQGHTVLNLATVQRMIIFQLKVKIIKKVRPLVKGRLADGNPLEDEEFRKAMSDYAQAVRDWELMVDYEKKAAGDQTKDPFCISSEWSLVRRAMNDASLESIDEYSHGNLDLIIGAFNQRNRINKERSFKAFIVRFATAMSGGIALIGPMLLMVLHKDTATDLATTSFSVILFAFFMAIYSNGSPEAIVGIVASYAAVLVVFVGTLE
ncbi:hypothetical protein F5B20DRAFT_579349 [Whalleya microplaca]|nr:hypothetical protein F5B20DRAFT_579349 [Whalleya microplaca]